MTETLEEMQARHRKEQRDLQSRVTSKKKNATKKTRKGVNDECANLERDLKERQERELASLLQGESAAADENEEELEDGSNKEEKDQAQANDDDYNAAANGISVRLKETTLSSEPSQQTQTQQQQNQQQPAAKKRNRQKERLARRAAEQEAEAEKAAHEAQGMTDHRGVERSSLERAFAAHGLVEHEIRPDGHCLFSAVADQLAQRGISVSIYNHNNNNNNTQTRTEGVEGGKEPAYKTIRRAATDYIQSHADDFVPFLEEPLDTYVHKIRDTAEWGGQLELLALASAYDVEIKVVQNGRTETIQPQTQTQTQTQMDKRKGEGEEEEGKKTIWLAYYRHGYGLGEHYNSLRVKDKRIN